MVFAALLVVVLQQQVVDVEVLVEMNYQTVICALLTSETCTSPGEVVAVSWALQTT